MVWPTNIVDTLTNCIPLSYTPTDWIDSLNTGSNSTPLDIYLSSFETLSDVRLATVWCQLENISDMIIHHDLKFLRKLAEFQILFFVVEGFAQIHPKVLQCYTTLVLFPSIHLSGKYITTNTVFNLGPP